MAIFILFALGFNFELELKKILSSNQFQINSKHIHDIHVFDQSKLC